MATIKLEGLNVASSANSVVTLDGSVAIAANHAGVKTALNASGDAGISACRAWVNFNGTLDENSGSLTAGENVLIRASFNVSSVYYNGTGDYTINFATAMPDANYVFTEGRNASGSGGTSVCTYSDATRLATSLRLLAVTGGNSVADSSTCLIAIFR